MSLDGSDMEEIRSLLADIRGAISETEAATAEIEQEREQMREDAAEWWDERSDEARNGEHGDDWRELQRRIDDGETTLADVLSGADESALAGRIREGSAERMADYIVAQRIDDAENEGARFAGLNEAFADLNSVIERFDIEGEG